ncbi:unnamed protein product, partial [Sphacelaria rigidula]
TTVEHGSWYNPPQTPCRIQEGETKILPRLRFVYHGMAYRSRQASPASASIARSNSRNKKGSRTSLTSGSAGRKRLTRDATIDDDVPAASAEVPGATTPMSGKHKGGKGVKSSKKDRATSAGVSAGGTEPTKTDGGLAIARAVQRSMRHGTRSED